MENLKAVQPNLTIRKYEGLQINTPGDEFSVPSFHALHRSVAAGSPKVAANTLDQICGSYSPG